MGKAMLLQTEFFIKAVNGSLITGITVRDTDSGIFNANNGKIKEITDIIN